MKVHPTAIIYDNVILGSNVEIGPYCIIGSPPEHLDYYFNENHPAVIIEQDTIITGHVTIDAGTEQTTHIGKRCFIMKGVHIGHDAQIEEDCIISAHAVVGGHVKLERAVTLGIGAITHQFVTIPENCMIGMGSVVLKGSVMEPGRVYGGNPVRYIRDQYIKHFR